MFRRASVYLLCHRIKNRVSFKLTDFLLLSNQVLNVKLYRVKRLLKSCRVVQILFQNLMNSLVLCKWLLVFFSYLLRRKFIRSDLIIKHLLIIRFSTLNIAAVQAILLVSKMKRVIKWLIKVCAQSCVLLS